jgi:hypothetical protein
MEKFMDPNDIILIAQRFQLEIMFLEPEVQDAYFCVFYHKGEVKTLVSQSFGGDGGDVLERVCHDFFEAVSSK